MHRGSADVEAWRKRWFVEDPPANAKDQWPKTETRFLLDFDPGYRLRRLYFLHRKISYFYRFPRDAGLAMSPEELARALPQDIAALLHDAASWQRFRDALIRIKHTLAGPVLTLRLVTHNLREDKELAARAKQVLPPEDVVNVSAGRSGRTGWCAILSARARSPNFQAKSLRVT